METPKFETWAIIELLGHQKIAGHISEQPLAGTNMLRVDVPETKRNPAFTRFISGAAIYAINPCNEEIAKWTAENINIQPIQAWDVNQFMEKKKLLQNNCETSEDEELGF